MPTTRNYSNTASQAALAGAIGATDTSINLTPGSFTGYPAAPFTAALARGTANEEIVLVTTVSGNTVTVTRGYDGTAAKAQGAGTTFQEVAAAVDFADANTHVNATSGVHGATGAVVGTTDAQTLTNKTLTAPTISGPTITGTATVGTANVTTLTVSGVTTLAGGSFSGALGVTGAATFSSTLGVTGVSTLTTANVTTLNVSGVSTLTGNATVGGTLGVTGATTLTTLTTSGAATLASGTVTAAPANAADLVRKDYVDTKANSVVAATSSTAASSASGASETLLTGAHNLLSGVALTAGRIYEAVYSGKIGTTGAGLIAVRLRVGKNATPTTTSTIIGAFQGYSPASGGPGQISMINAAQPFQVTASDTYQIAVFCAISGVIVAADDRGHHGITVYDRGPVGGSTIASI